MKKYLQYNSIDFSQEPSFIRWVKDRPYSDDINWDSWLSEHPEKYREIDDAKRIVRSINFKNEAIPADLQDQLWHNINNATKAEAKEIIPRRTILRYLPYGIAAALAVFAIMNINSDTQYSTTIAELQEVILPDGSEIIVNAESILSYDEDTWDEKRNVHLSGEAFFKVKKGSKFNVETEYGSVEVLGTSFNVYARDNSLNVVCETGKVGVTTPNKETILTPNQSVTVTEGIHDHYIEVSSIESRSNWTSGIFIYKNTSLQEVISELERQLDLSITIDNSLLQQEYSGSFNKKDANTALSEVFWPLGLKYKQEGKSIIVSQ